MLPAFVAMELHGASTLMKPKTRKKFDVLGLGPAGLHVCESLLGTKAGCILPVELIDGRQIVLFANMCRLRCSGVSFEFQVQGLCSSYDGINYVP